ncbi:thiamine pyrophosphate-binding protein [Amycolatopsis mongoliensis]|uniref:Thiamine pyrophosphate-binding protein n=1 Tax=Amycolatopsis mongoliensis TaxID=715475 RepID=A0A9Y2NGN4_9PSEU|nr:thiamine pyrophosphate-dependent enzyme [Amycolatopsis sp. 4-36]WIY00989.1 thiamine pyrophosphate-binding protein [Amycolatopsis sp. 4-36]
MPTVKDVSFEVLRRFGLTTLFANPGSTEVSLLAGLPSDLDFVLGLHEASVIGIATGYALRTGRPALALLHTTAGLGNAVGALATARVNRASLVVVVGQQDRRHLAAEPFLAGRLHGLAGEYPVWQHQPERPQDVPAALARAWHEARDARGPAIVVVPMADWDAEADLDAPFTAPATLHRGRGVDDAALAEVAALLEGSTAPVVVAGAGNDSPAGWAALTGLAERLDCPVWQEAFGARAGFPQDHRLFAGHLPAARSGLRKALAAHDVVLTVGAPAFRQYPYESGAFVESGTRLAVITDDPAEAHRSPADVAVVADPAEAVALLTRRLPAASGPAREALRRPRPSRPGPGDPLRAVHVLDALAERLPHDAVLLEETPSSRPDLHALVPARAPLGFLSAAMGGLGFALPAAIGVRLAGPDRPVVAVLGDGASLYSIQALWSAWHYRVGALFVVLANGRYAIMDRLSEQAGAAVPAWPPFTEVSVTTLARGFGCPAERVEDHPNLLATLDTVLPTLAGRREPLLLEVAVEPGDHYRARTHHGKGYR